MGIGVGKNILRTGTAAGGLIAWDGINGSHRQGCIIFRTIIRLVFTAGRRLAGKLENLFHRRGSYLVNGKSHGGEKGSGHLPEFQSIAAGYGNLFRDTVSPFL